MINNISLIVGREFRERVRKKSFIITTLLMPIFIIGLMVAPALLMEYTQGEEKQIAVIDESGLVAPHLMNNHELRFEVVDIELAEARQSLADRFGVLYIGSDILTNPRNVRLYANSSTSISLEGQITSQIEQVIENEKLKSYHIEELDRILAEVDTKVVMQTFRNDKSTEENAGSSSIVATGIGYVLGLALYMILMIYGSMVMQSVIEEKNSRVLEVLVSSVKPFDLMMGKILGVASVAVVQVAIWAVLVVGASCFVLPQLLPAEALSAAEGLSTANIDPEMAQIVGAMSDAGYLAKIFGLLILFIVGGFLLYSAMFAAIGSAVDSLQDAQQLQTPVMLPIIFGLVGMMTVINDPNSTVAFWLSVIPFTSPIVMMARIPYEVPLWEVALSLVVLYCSFMVMVWAAGKIYRVGIFMYGKKPSFKELWKWMRYKY